MLDKFKERKFEYIMFILFVIYMICSLFFHEPWRDEAQSFLLIKNLSFVELFNQLKIEGHPIVWYAIIFPFIKAGCPVVIQNIFSSVFAGIAFFLVLFHAPFKNEIKIFFIVTTPLIFNYSVIGRGYSVVLLFVIIILTIFNDRYGKYFILYMASLFILINTELYSAIIAGSFVASDIIMSLIKKDFSNQKKIIIACIVLFLSAVVLFITIFPGSYYKTYLEQTGYIGAVGDFLKIFYNTFLGAYRIITAVLGNESVPFMLIFAVISLGMFLFGIIFEANKLKRKNGYYSPVLFAVFFSALYILTLFTERFGSQHGGILLLMLWSPIWIIKLADKNNSKSLTRFIAAFSIVMLVFSFSELMYAFSDITRPYSGSKDTASFIIDNGFDQKDTLLITTDAPEISSVLIYLENIQQYKSPDGYMSFVDFRRWHNNTDLPITSFDFEQLIGADYTKYKHILLIAQESRFDSGGTIPYKEIFANIESSRPAIQENFRVYIIK